MIQQVAPDSIAAAVREVFAAPEYDWRVRRSLGDWFLQQFLSVLAALERLKESHVVAYWVVIGLLAAVALTILVHLGYVIWKALHPAARPEAGPAAAPVIHDAAWHLREARRLGDAGRFTEALAHRFVALVLDLQRRHALTFNPAKTPAEYVREARLDPDGRQRLADVVSALYSHLFGGAPCTAADWAAFHEAAEVVGRSRVAAA